MPCQCSEATLGATSFSGMLLKNIPLPTAVIAHLAGVGAWPTVVISHCRDCVCDALKARLHAHSFSL